MGWGFLIGVTASVGSSGLFAFSGDLFPNPSDIAIIRPAHLPRVEGVSGALTQKCVGASVFLGSPKCITLFREFADVVASWATSRLMPAVFPTFQAALPTHQTVGIPCE